MLKVIHRRRMVVNIPFPIAKIMAGAFSVGNFISGGLAPMPITPDQVRALAHDVVVGPDAKGLADLGINPTGIDAVLPEYLWRFRPSGQFDAIKDSAKNLKV